MFPRYAPVINLRFIEGEAEGSDAPQVDAPVEAAPVEAPAVDSSGPWAPIKDQLDPISWGKVEPLLKDIGRNADKKISDLSGQYAPWKEFADNQVTPDSLRAALNVAQQIDSDPALVYQKLGEFLNETGRMPTQQELANEVQDAENGGEQAQQEDPRLAEMQQRLGQFEQMFQQQAHQQQVESAGKQLDAEMAQIRQAHPELSDEDQTEIFQRAVTMTQIAQQSGQKVPTLTEAADAYLNLRTRFLSAPRPGEGAPKLIPTSGGVSTGGTGQQSLGQLGRGDTQSLVADLLRKSQG